MSCLDCNQTAIPQNPVLTPPVYPPDPPNPPGGRCGGVTLDWECVVYRGLVPLRFGVLPGESLLDAWQRLVDGAALTEQEVRDLVGAMFEDTTTISFVYNPLTGKVSATYTGAVIGSEGVSDERIRDVIGAALEDTASIDTVYDDVADRIRFNVKEAFVNALIDARTKTDEQLQDFIAAMFTGQAGVTYDDAAGKILLSFGGGGGGGGTQYAFSGQFALTPDGSGGFAVAIGNNTSVQRVEVAVGGTLIGTRKRINLVAGANTTITAADDNAGDEVDVTIGAAGVGYATQPQVEQAAADVSAESPTTADDAVAVKPSGLFFWLKKVLTLPFKWTGLQSFNGGIRGDGFAGVGERIVVADNLGNIQASTLVSNLLPIRVTDNGGVQTSNVTNFIFDGNFVISNPGANTVRLEKNLFGLLPVKTTDLSAVGNLQGIFVDPVLEKYYLILQSGSLQVRNLKSDKLLMNIPGAGNVGIFLKDPSTAFTTTFGGQTVLSVDLVNGTSFVLSTAAAWPSQLQYNPVTNELFVCGWDSQTVYVINATSGALVRSYPVSGRAFYICLDAANDRYFLTLLNSNQISVRNIATDVVIQTITVPGVTRAATMFIDYQANILIVEGVDAGLNVSFFVYNLTTQALLQKVNVPFPTAQSSFLYAKDGRIVFMTTLFSGFLQRYLVI